MKHLKIFALACASVFYTSCSNSDDDVPVPKDLMVPSTYMFERDGKSTVSFGGQNTRILMANEIYSELLDFANNSEAKILSMYKHQEGASDFSDAALNSTSKNIRSKVAASADYFASNSVDSENIKTYFEDLIKNQARSVKPNYQNMATKGMAGQLVFGSKTRYVNEKGFENNQLFAKGLIGALVTDQTLNNYLSTAVLDAGDNVKNNDASMVANGKPYTTMEHKWDEAYGYVYGGNVENEANPNASQNVHNKFLHNYIKKVDGNPNFAGIKDDIYNAFKKGRAAIVAKKYNVRDEQVKILREKISTVIAVRAIHYLQEGKDNIDAGTRTAGFHALSEAVGFVYSLQFTKHPETGQPYMTRSEVMGALDNIFAGDGLWDVDSATLDNLSKTIAARFSTTVEKAK